MTETTTTTAVESSPATTTPGAPPPPPPSIVADKNKQAELLATAFYAKGRKLWTKGDKEESLELFRKALALQESTLGTYHKNTARTYYWVGFAWKYKQEYDKALVAYRRTLQIRLSLFGEEDISTEDGHRAVKDVLQVKGWSDEQIAKYFQALANSVHHQTNGQNAYDAGDFDQAVEEYQECLAIEQVAEGRFPLDSAHIQAKIGDAYQSMGRFDMAINSYREALSIYDPKLGREHPATIGCVTGIELACMGRGLDEGSTQEYCSTAIFDSITFVSEGDRLLHSADGEKVSNLEMATESYEIAVQLEEASLGRDPLTVAGIHRKIAAVLTLQEHYDRSIWVLRTALSIFIFECGCDHPAVLSTLKEIGHVLQEKGIDPQVVNKYLNTVSYSVKFECYGETVNKEGEYGTAMQEFQKSLVLEVSGLGKHHLTQAALFRGIGNAYIGLEKFDHALVNYRHSLLIQLHNLGIDHAGTQKTIRRVVYAAEDKGMDEDSVEEYREGIVESVALELAGDIFLKSGDPEKAASSFQAAIVKEEFHLGRFHLCTADLYGKIAIALKVLGDTDRALAAYRSVLALNQIRLGSDHPNTDGALEELEAAAKRKGLSDKNAHEYCGKAVVAISLEQDADDHIQAEAFEVAVETYSRAIEIEESSLGPSHLTTAFIYSKIGDAYRLQGEAIEALLVYRNSLRIQMSFGGEGSESTRRHLGLAILGLGFSEPTALQYNRVIRDSIDHEVEGDKAHVEGDDANAISEYRRTISLEESVLGKLCATTTALYKKMADICEDQEDYQSAMLFYSKVVALQEAYLGKENPETLRSYNSLVLTAEKLANANNAGLQGWVTLKFILMGLIGLLMLILSTVKTLSKREAPIKKLSIDAYQNKEASPRSETLEALPIPILRGAKSDTSDSVSPPTNQQTPSEDSSFVMVDDSRDGQADDETEISSVEEASFFVASENASFVSKQPKVAGEVKDEVKDEMKDETLPESRANEVPSIEPSPSELDITVRTTGRSTMSDSQGETCTMRGKGGITEEKKAEALTLQKDHIERDSMNVAPSHPTSIQMTKNDTPPAATEPIKEPTRKRPLSLLAKRYLALVQVGSEHPPISPDGDAITTSTEGPPPLEGMVDTRSLRSDLDTSEASVEEDDFPRVESDLDFTADLSTDASLLEESFQSEELELILDHAKDDESSYTKARQAFAATKSWKKQQVPPAFASPNSRKSSVPPKRSPGMTITIPPRNAGS